MINLCFTQVKRSLSAGESFTHYVTLELKKAFLQPVKYQVSYNASSKAKGASSPGGSATSSPSSTRKLPLIFPAVLTKFCHPLDPAASVVEQQPPGGFNFLKCWAELGAPQEVLLKGKSKAGKVLPDLGLSSIEQVLKGLNIHVVSKVGQPDGGASGGVVNENVNVGGFLYCGACNLYLSGKLKPSMVLCKLDCTKVEMYSIAVRAADSQVAKTMAQIFGSYLVESAAGK